MPRATSTTSPGFREGGVRLRPYELEMVGDVAGKSLLHLQCHFGIDTLSWARLGRAGDRRRLLAVGRSSSRTRSPTTSASPTPGSSARTCTTCPTTSTAPSTSSTHRGACSAGCPTSAAGPRSSPTSWRRAARSSSPRPIRSSTRSTTRAWRRASCGSRYPYFEHPEPLVFPVKGSYADPDADVGEQAEHGWDHGLGEIVIALIDAGLRIESLVEHPFIAWAAHFLVEAAGRRAGTCRRTTRGELPLMFSLGRPSPPAERASGDARRRPPACGLVQVVLPVVGDAVLRVPGPSGRAGDAAAAPVPDPRRRCP